MFFLDKKSLPESLKTEINFKTLTELFKKAKEEYDNFEYTINYNNQYLIDIESTFNWYKNKGIKYKITGYRIIYLISDGKIYSNRV